MDKELKKKWLEALRSGDYKQGFFTLKRKYEKETQHCCLGVLCELVAEDYPKEIHITDEYIEITNSRSQSSTKDILTLELAQFLGITHHDLNTITRLNDCISGNTFNQIADWIEKKL